MPCFVGDEDLINLAQYGNSNSGRMKTLYREGLKRRYGSLMQIISGVHFNFSFPESFWDQFYGSQTDEQRCKPVRRLLCTNSELLSFWLVNSLFLRGLSHFTFVCKGNERIFSVKLVYHLPHTSLRLS